MGRIKKIFNNDYFQVFGIIFASLFFAFVVAFVVLVAVECSPCLEFRNPGTDGTGYAGKS